MHSSCPGRTLRFFKTGLPEMAYRYNHKLMKLAEAVLREVVHFKVEEDRFQVSQRSSVVPTVMPTAPSVDLTHANFVSFARMRVIIFQYQCAFCDLSINVPAVQCCSPDNTAMPRLVLSPHGIAHTTRHVCALPLWCHP